MNNSINKFVIEFKQNISTCDVKIINADISMSFVLFTNGNAEKENGVTYSFESMSDEVYEVFGIDYEKLIDFIWSC